MEPRICPLCKRTVLPKLAFCPYDGTKIGKAIESKPLLPAIQKPTPKASPLPDTANTIQDEPGGPPETRPVDSSELFLMASGEGVDLSAATLDLRPGAERLPFQEDIIESSQEIEISEGSQIGDYTLEKQIGAGGMGMVWSAKNSKISRVVALKILHLDRITHKNSFQRFVQEAKVVNQINHPNLIDIFSFGKLADGRPYFVMEHLKGKSLKTLVDEKGAQPLKFILPVFEQICDVMQAVHDKGVIHRDLKPDNIFLCETRESAPFVKLLDFGIAKLGGDGDGASTPDLTKTGSIIGTLGYMSPEQIQRSKGVSNKADIYSLGVILYELLTGKGPFSKSGNSIADVLIAQIQETQRPSAGNPARRIPQALDEFVVRAMHHQPERRPSSCKEFFAELASIVKSLEEEIVVKSGQLMIIDPTMSQPTEHPEDNTTAAVEQARAERPASPTEEPQAQPTMPIKAIKAQLKESPSSRLIWVLLAFFLFGAAALVTWQILFN